MSLFRMLGMGIDIDEDNLISPRDINSPFSSMFPPMMRPMNEFGPPMLLPSPLNTFGMGLGGMLGMMEMSTPFLDVRSPFFQDISRSHPVNSAPGGGGGQVFFSSNVVTMTNGPDGRPEVYQASSSVRSGPGGLKETVKAVSDTRSGVKKMQIGHHIGEKGHVIERERNYRAGTAEERQEFINIEEEEADSFETNWQNLARMRQNPVHSIEYRKYDLVGPSSRRPIEGSQSRSHHSDHRKKRPYEADRLHKRKNFRGSAQAVTEPVPVVELPDSDSEESPKDPQSSSSVGPTIVEVLD